MLSTAVDGSVVVVAVGWPCVLTSVVAGDSIVVVTSATVNGAIVL